MHFAVALSLGDHPIGVLLAGQLFEPYPERQPREIVAETPGLSLDGVRELDRQEHPGEQATLLVYAELLGTLGQMLLETHYQACREAERLDEMTRLHDRTMTEIAERRRVEERQRFLLGASDEFDSRDSETTLKRLALRAVPFLADVCFVDVVADDETIRRVGWRTPTRPSKNASTGSIISSRPVTGRTTQFPGRCGRARPTSSRKSPMTGCGPPPRVRGTSSSCATWTSAP